MFDEPFGVRFRVSVHRENLTAVHYLNMVLPKPIAPVEGGAECEQFAIPTVLRPIMIFISGLLKLELQKPQLLPRNIPCRFALLLEHVSDVPLPIRRFYVC